MPLFTKRKVADGQDALLIGKGKEKGDEYGTIDNDRSEKAKEKNEKNKSTSKPRSLTDLYRFSTPFDAILITFGVLGSIANGAGMPLMAIIFGGMSNTFIKIEKITQSGLADNFTLFSSTMPSLNSGLEEFNQNVITYSIYYVYMGLGILVVAYVQTACWMITCERQIHKIRKQFLKSILRQEIAWFDQKQTGELTAQLSGNLDRIKEGIGDKFGILVQYLTQMVTGYVIAFVYNWKLTLVMMALAPVMLGLGIAVWKVLSAISKREHTEYAAAGAIADQVLSCIKTVMAFNGQKQEHARYEKALEEAKKTGIKRGLFQGVSIGVIMLSIFGSYSLALWYGAKLIVWKELDPGTVFIVLMSVMSGSQSLGNISPQFAVLAAAKSGAASIFDIIDAKPTIDPYSTSGRKLEKPMGKIQFSNVKFAYPTRKEVTVLKDVSFSVDSGQCVAVVGSSGSGKSTIVSLLLRYYDVDAGRVSIDGENIKNLNLHWLRRLIAVVSQEPVLFDATIEENIRFGRMDVSRTEIIHAAQMANAHDFISGLPEAYRTRVGERGTQLSGGQKQRIAIARALVRRPKILLLDEATSALDAESESLVQEALDLARQGRTTIVIAHRLSTIRNADKIVAIKDGQLYETGTHDELMSKKGLYYDLVTAQTFDTIAPENIMVSEEDDVFLNGAENGPDASAAALVRRTSSTRRTASRSGYMSGSEPESVSARRLSRMLSRGVETEKERLEREAKEERAEKSTVLAIMKENKPEWWAITLGLVGATIRGAGFPLFSLFYSQMFAVYTKEDDILLSESNFWALMMVAMGLVMALGDVISSSCFGISSENLTMRLRLKTFQNILRQDAAYFDNPAHVTGKLCTRLATDAAMIKGAVDQRMSTILTSVVSMVAGIVVGMLYSWELTLLMLLILPLFALGMYVRFKVRIRRGAENRDGLLLEAAGQTASEAIENIRTVQALTREIPVYETFCRYLQTPYKQALRHTQSHAISYAFSQCIIFFFYAACFRFGAYLVMQGKLGPMDIFKVFFVIMFSGMTVGWATAYFPEMMKARIAAGLIMKMINERPRIDNCSNAGLKSDYTGSVTFDAVYFLYPSRPNSHVLRGLSFQVSPGRTVALVGASGCGKSTIVNLIERFYDPTDGRILIDNQDLKTMNLQSSRDQMALVSQEPTLFDCSIYDNILYGTTGIEHERVIEAARLANIHEFVMGLPEGYATRVGEKGVQLSGGQKQRIAIARALVRNPKILLLDEATSALDTESEKLVQDALDKARRGRTCIMIAHRLSTIQNADRIFVLKNGRIVEEGSHMELVNARGPYYELTKRQHKPH